MRADTALIQLRPPRRVVHDSVIDCTDTEIDGWEVYLMNVPGVNPTEEALPFWVHVHELLTEVTLPGPDSVKYVWGRGLGSTGWKHIAAGETYDSLAHPPHVEVADWDGAYEVVLRSYTYEVFTEQNGAFLGWHPYEPGAGAYTAHYSYVAHDPMVNDVGSELREDAGLRVLRQGRDRVWFGLSVDRVGRWRVEVFDVAGRQVASLLDARVDAGRHVLEWDCRNASGHRVAAGVYFVRAGEAEGAGFRGRHVARAVVVR